MELFIKQLSQAKIEVTFALKAFRNLQINKAEVFLVIFPFILVLYMPFQLFPAEVEWQCFLLRWRTIIDPSPPFVIKNFRSRFFSFLAAYFTHR
jgi:hypothetical protein